MSRNTKKNYLKIVREGYKEIYAPLKFANSMLLILAAMFALILLAYEPADEWHTTNFTLSRYEYRSVSRGGLVLDLYTTDGRYYTLNKNVRTIGHQLKQGNKYNAVYSEDLFRDIIKGLSDTDDEYLNADEMRKSYTTERLWFSALLVVCVFLLLTFNSVYIIYCIKTDKNKKRQRKKKRR